ncbi:class I SAM-dependent methyltransferase [Roseococcus sp. YIM B11640]|uniref:class I SAM-dependent methyltransferase n=1 Tax=Roseococcus sp. YIM B11640 TaxID=3133973 RepID=UPI003C7B7273
MAGSSRGYVSAAGYDIAWQAAQTPAHLAVVCAMAGVSWQLRDRMQIADLGCGRGYTVNTLAAANPDWSVLGLDSDPVNIAEGLQTAAEAGLGNAFFAETDLGAITDEEIERLPVLDVALVHGVWSWVSDEVRAGILRVLSRRLKPGGIAYFGYNALPASQADFALQRLLRHLAGPLGTSAEEVLAAAARAMDRLREIAPRLKLQPTPMLKRLLAEPVELSPAFVAHEFLTEHWRPCYPEDLQAALAPAKLDFVGSCNLFEHIPGLVCDAAQLAVLETLPPGMAREFLKDLCLPRAFRADVFVRGGRRVNPMAAMNSLLLAPCRPLPEEGPVLVTGTGKATFAPEVWREIAAALEDGPKSVGRLCAMVSENAPGPAELLAVLDGTSLVLPAFRPPSPTPAATRFNIAAAAIHARRGDEAGHFALASPVAAGGLPASSLDLALVGALLDGTPPSPAQLARRLQPHRDAEGLERAAGIIEAHLGERMPIWQRFGVI